MHHAQKSSVILSPSKYQIKNLRTDALHPVTFSIFVLFPLSEFHILTSPTTLYFQILITCVLLSGFKINVYCLMRPQASLYNVLATDLTRHKLVCVFAWQDQSMLSQKNSGCHEIQIDNEVHLIKMKVNIHTQQPLVSRTHALKRLFCSFSQ